LQQNRLVHPLSTDVLFCTTFAGNVPSFWGRRCAKSIGQTNQNSATVPEQGRQKCSSQAEYPDKPDKNFSAGAPAGRRVDPGWRSGSPFRRHPCGLP
jgi:hypothetical protein